MRIQQPKVAKLARIEVESQDLTALAKEFNDILGFIEQLNEVDVEGIEPMTSVTPQKLIRRSDNITDGDKQTSVLKCASLQRGFLRCTKGCGVMANLNSLTISEARDKLKSKEISSLELTNSCLSAIDAADALGAFVHKTPELAIEQAKRADERLKKENAPDLCGIPLGIKDLFCTKGVESQAGSRILENFKPEYESTVSQNLLDNGTVMLGKLNMDEFAMGSSNETSIYGNAINPWKIDDRGLTPGGSSGGSAAAVAADLCLAATGTDTGGSISSRRHLLA